MTDDIVSELESDSEKEVVDGGIVEEVSGLTDGHTMQVGAFFIGVNAGFLAGANAGAELRDVSLAFILTALGMRAAPGPLSGITKAPYFAIVGYAVGVLAGYGLAHPAAVQDILRQAGF